MEQIKTNREIARAILRRYMADYTSQRTPPKSVKGGFFAILICDTGEVWLSETNNFATIISHFHCKTSNAADCVKQARQRGSDLELWFLTQPQRFSAQALEHELYEADLLASRKSPIKDGAGELYVIRHRTTMAYFVVTNRQSNVVESTILGNFLDRLENMSGNSRNVKLSQFVTDQASDILMRRHFDITYLDSFKDKEDEWLKRQVYIDSCSYGENLNLNSVD